MEYKYYVYNICYHLSKLFFYLNELMSHIN